MQENILSLLKLNSKIFRMTQVHLDKVLKEYELSSGSYTYLFILKNNEGISQNKLSEELGYDKAMSARTITKLIRLGYLDRQKDDDDSRANKIYLTAKAKVVIEELLEKIHELIRLITKDLNDDEKTVTINSLNKILSSIRKLK